MKPELQAAACRYAASLISERLKDGANISAENMSAHDEESLRTLLGRIAFRLEREAELIDQLLPPS